MLSVAVLTGLFAFGASAADPAAGDIDTTSATLTWEAKVPTVVNGEWVTITGQNGGALVDAGLTINQTVASLLRTCLLKFVTTIQQRML